MWRPHQAGSWAPAVVLRLVWLHAVLIGFDISVAPTVRAGLGLDLWDVLHQRFARHLNVPIGWVIVALSAVVLLAWRRVSGPGWGSVSNAVMAGPVADAALGLVPSPVRYRPGDSCLSGRS